jgi:hypothetical protein
MVKHQVKSHMRLTSVNVAKTSNRARPSLTPNELRSWCSSENNYENNFQVYRYNSSMETSDEVSPVRAAVVGDKDKVIDWLKQYRHDSVADRTTIQSIILQAALCGHTDICQLIINTGAVVDKHWLAAALQNACSMGHLSTAQLLIQHCDTSNTQCLQTALGAACYAGELTVVNWLMDVMKLSPADTIKWWLITASARGDINTVRQLVQREALYTSDVVSDGLRVACDRGGTNVVDWLMTHTSADASKRGVVYIMNVEGDVTSLYAACQDVSINNHSTTAIKCYASHC